MILIEIMPCLLIFEALLLFSSYVYIYPTEQKLFTQIFVKNHYSHDLDNPENFEVAFRIDEQILEDSRKWDKCNEVDHKSSLEVSISNYIEWILFRI